MTSKAFGLAQLGNVYSDGSLSSRNKVINGAMVIDQRNAGAALTANGAFPVDRFFISESTDGGFSVQRVLEAPAGLLYSAKFTTTTADASLTATQNIHLHHRVEGLNVADLGWGTSAAQTVTLSFWVRSSLTGTFGGAFRNSATDRSYPFTYSISAADTWEYKTVTVAGDTSGTWLKDTGNGVSIMWGLGAGPDRSGTAGAWAGATYVSATGAVSVIGTLDATWQITGVQLEAGDTATPFEHRSYGQELALCERYYQKSYPTGNVFGDNVNTGCFGFIPQNTDDQVNVNFPVKMRASPTVRLIRKNGGAQDEAQRADNAGTYIDLTISLISDAGFDFAPDTASTRRYRFHYDVNAEL
jgi:hypothetical protein